MLKKSLVELQKLARRPGFWIIGALLVLITLPYYDSNLKHPSFLISITANLGLGRHSFERILYLAPILWSGFLFRRRWVIVTSSVALVLMLPGAILGGDNPLEAGLECAAIFIAGNILGLNLGLLRRERERSAQLENAQRDLKASEQRYRELFENAQDAIWLHDLNGKIVAANRATGRLTGYTVPELTQMDVRQFLSEDSLSLAGQIRQKLLDGEHVKQPYEQHITRKDGSEAFLQLATSVVRNNGRAVAFQHVARDVTDQKRLQENQSFYLQEATKAQEEERKRISRELHDETIQSLVVLSRRLDALATTKKGISPELRLHLEELWQQTNDIMQEVRRLSQDLRPPALDRLGLAAALQFLATDVAKYSGMDINLSLSGTARRLPEEVELTLFRITQEALRNVWRHAHSSHADIKADFQPGKVFIRVSDNGRGFGLPSNMSDLARDGKLGLAGMQERARLIGASLSVESDPGHGTKVTIELPTEVPVKPVAGQGLSGA